MRFYLASGLNCRHFGGMIASKAPQDLTATTSLQGSLLVAMPSLDDPNFDHSVIYICQHDAESAMGLILNQPVKGLGFEQMAEELGIEITSKSNHIPHIYNGGPVQNDRGFVLHSLDYFLDDVTLALGLDVDELDIKRGIGMTVSRDILVDLAQGKGPSHSLIALGYAGWHGGQLEAELRGNAWLVAPADPDLLFCHQPKTIWQKALKNLGISPERLSHFSGQA
jgi:putative transcriptional regulator